MPVFEKEILTALGSGEFGGLNKENEWVMPSYDGFGLVNLTPTVAHWLGAGPMPSPVFGQPILKRHATIGQSGNFWRLGHCKHCRGRVC